MKYFFLPILICFSSVVLAEDNVLNDPRTKAGWEKEQQRVKQEEMQSKTHDNSYKINSNTSIGPTIPQPTRPESEPTPPPATSKEDRQKNLKEENSGISIKQNF